MILRQYTGAIPCKVMDEDLFAKLDEYLIAQIVEIVERECGINSVLSLARTCARMNAIIVPMMVQLMLKNISRKLTYASDDRIDYGVKYDQWIYVPLPFWFRRFDD